MEKVTASPKWTYADRASLIQAIHNELNKVKATETEMRKTCKWESPALVANAQKQLALEDLMNVVAESSSEFLELNRGNFSEFLM